MTDRELVGVLPAAGAANRLGRLPCSKEILPLAVANRPGDRPRVKVAIEMALEAFREAGIGRAVVVIAPGKEDISRFLGDGASWGVELVYRTRADSPGAAWSIDAGREFVGDADTALAFPDIQFSPVEALRKLARSRGRAQADLWLALVPSTRGDKVDLVRTDATGGVTGIDIKPGPGQRGWTWVTALWRPRFADFLHGRLETATYRSHGAGERHVGDVINDALTEGYVVRSLAFPDGEARDVGTPEDLAREWRGPTR